MGKRVLFDGLATQGTKKSPYSGGADYAIFILESAIDSGYEFDIVLSSQLVTNPKVSDILRNHPEIKVINVSKPQEVLELIKGSHYDKFYSALPSRYTDYSAETPFIGVIHGLRSIECPWDDMRIHYAVGIKQKLQYLTISLLPALQRRLRKKHISHTRKLMEIKNASYIVVSNHTKYSILHFYPHIDESDIKVYYSPQSMVINPTPKKDYFLMVNGNRFEKNVYRAVQVFDRLFSEGRLKDKKVIITGCGDLPFFRKIVNRNRFELLPYVTSEQLQKLYSEAFCFVYPSLNEGFGYPPIQAMTFGTPVIASAATSIPEVCAGAAIYFSPENTDDLANRILYINSDSSFRNSLVEKGYRRVQELIDIQSGELSEELAYIFE